MVIAKTLRIFVISNINLKQISFALIFALWVYCTLRLSTNTFEALYISLTQGGYNLQGIMKWQYFILQVPGWWFLHLLIMIWFPFLLFNSKVKSLLEVRIYKFIHLFFWFIIAPLIAVIFS